MGLRGILGTDRCTVYGFFLNNKSLNQESQQFFNVFTVLVAAAALSTTTKWSYKYFYGSKIHDCHIATTLFISSVDPADKRFQTQLTA